MGQPEPREVEQPAASPATSAPRLIAGLAVTAGFFVLFFWAGGGPGWTAGWLYVALLTVGQTTNTLILKRKNPDLLERRGSVGRGTKRWDKAVLALFGLTYLGELVVGALDGGRFHWAPLPWWSWPLGVVLYGAGLGLVTWAMVENAHFEKTVRIQTDRRHRVVSSGPYRLVRHPGYAGTIAAFPFASALLVGSGWALAAALVCAAALVLRTALEDRTLRAELEGYEKYVSQTRARLIPGIW